MIVVYGTICLDRIRKVPYLPKPGGYVEMELEVVLPGGEATNTALALLKWHADFCLAGNPIGADEVGRQLAEMLAKQGLHVGAVGDHSHRTPFCDIYVTPDGQRTMLGWGFASIGDSMDPADVPMRVGDWVTVDQNHGEASRLVAERALLTGANLYLLDIYQEEHLVGLNANPERVVWQSSTDWVGVPGDNQANLDWLSKWVSNHGWMTILTDGPRGFYAASPSKAPRHFPIFPCPELVDSTGAGDIFRAGVLCLLEEGSEIEDALRFASAAASLKCAGLGASSKIPTEDDVLAHIERHPDINAQFEWPDAS